MPSASPVPTGNRVQFQSSHKGFAQNLDAQEQEAGQGKREQGDNLEQQKRRLQSMSSLLGKVQNSGQQQQNCYQKSQLSQQNISYKSMQSKGDQLNSDRQHNDPSTKQTQISIIQHKVQHQTNNHNHQSRHKSKFAVKRHHHQALQQPHIITSSHKNLFNPTINNKLNNLSVSSSKFLSPEIYSASQPMKLTTTEHILHEQNKRQKNSNNLMDSQKVFKSGSNLLDSQKAFNNRSKNQSNVKKAGSFELGVKSATFAVLTPQTRRKQECTGGVSLYEQVLAKNFQVIDNLLKKINQIYSHQQEYQTTITQISQKLHKLEVDNENIHHEFRTSHFMIDKKLNSMNNEHSNILQDMNLMKKLWNQSGGVGASNYFSGSFVNGEDDADENTRRKKHLSTARKNSHRSNSRFRKQSFSRVGVNREQRKNMPQGKISNWTNLKGLDQQNLGKILKKINQSSSRSGSSYQEQSYSFCSDQLSEGKSYLKKRARNKNGVDQFPQSREYENEFNYFRDQNRKGNKSSSSRVAAKSMNKKPRVSIDSFDLEQISQLKSYISQEFIKMSGNSEQLKKFTQFGIEAMMNSKCEALQGKLQDKIVQFRKQVLEEKLLKQFKKSLVDEIQPRTNSAIQKNLEAMRNQLENKISQVQNRLNQQIANKYEKEQGQQDLNQILESTNRKFNTLMNQSYHKFAQRTQTKRAIIFLQKKMNKMIQIQKRYNPQSSLQTNQDVKCLSCNKSVPYNTSPNHSHSQYTTPQQAMFTRVRLLSPVLNQAQQQSLAYRKDQNSIVMARKNLDSNQSQNDHSNMLSKNNSKVRFTDVRNSNGNSTSNCTTPAKNMQSLNSSIRPSNQKNTKSSKQLSMNRVKNCSNISQSVHLTAATNKLNAQENRPTTSNFSQISQKNWKQKAVTLLKKQTMTTTGTNWRSKSTYKKV